ncbi:MAG: DUF1566 domain-containing protein [Gammaproteobacteria bacterium]|nr:DUF1566 domain-containing protein [Gammaproteobacteria bacterium]
MIIFILSFYFFSVGADDNTSVSKIEKELEELYGETNEMLQQVDNLFDDPKQELGVDSQSLSDLIDKQENKKLQKQVAEQLPKQHCDELFPSQHNFSICGNDNNSGRYIFDNKTGLMWSRCSLGKLWNQKKLNCEGNSLKLSWQQALQKIEEFNLSSSSYFHDWRLPNIKELSSLANLSCTFPTINLEFFPDTESVDFWTSSVFENHPSRAWYINFALGHDNNVSKLYFKQVRMVRLGSKYSPYNITNPDNKIKENYCADFVDASTAVVLLPDDDGKVGKVLISNDAGNETLTKAFTQLKVNKNDTVMAKPIEVSEADIKADFDSLLSALPSKAKNFTLYFSSGTTSLTKQSQEQFSELIELLNNANQSDVYIVGHTDTQGDEEENYQLGMERAETVAKLLNTKLTNKVTSVKTSSDGEKNLLIKTKDNVNEQQNRRVEISIHL